MPTFNLEDQREIPKFRQLRKRADTANAVTQPEVARILNVSEDSIQRAQKVLKLGVPELIEKVERGEIEVKPAAKIAEVKPRFIEFDGCVPLINFIVSLNLHRRHLSESQRGIVAAKISDLQHGGNRRSDQSANLHHENISRHMGILLRDANHLWPIGPKCLQSVPATKPPRR